MRPMQSVRWFPRGLAGLVTRSLVLLLTLCVLHGAFSSPSLAQIYIDVNAPSLPKFNIAIPDFKNLGDPSEHPQLATELAEVISNDLLLSGYFNPMDKRAFLEPADAPLTADGINFRDWSVIGTELLIKAGYTCVGQRLEVELRLFDVFWGRQILGRRALGSIDRSRHLMHRLANEIILRLTGHQGIFLTKLAFVGTATGTQEIYISDFDGHNVTPLTKDKSISILPRWSPDGRKLAFNSYKEGDPILYLQDMETRSLKRISSRQGLNIGASWAPDGQEIALTMSFKGNPDIFTIDLTGKITRQVVDHWAIDVSPSFSPDGRQMAFVSNRSGSPQIYILDLEGGNERRITFEGNYNTSPRWSSLNRIVFTTMSQGRFNICTINPDGSGLRYLTQGGGDNDSPCWSPDGRYIAFNSNRTGRHHIYLMNANGQNQTRVTHEKGDQTEPSWAPE